VDFAFRRTHGREAAMAVARASAIVGFTATSNVEAARRYGLEVGRHDGAFVHRGVPVRDRCVPRVRGGSPDRTTFLVDTYDTLQGVATAIEVVREMQLTGRLGIRLDSGDLLELSRGARALLDEAGLTQVRIFASGGLDELEVQDLVAAGAPLDAFGIGRRWASRPTRRSWTRSTSSSRSTAPGAQALGRQGDRTRP
jgi:nicotinate phosphoribosyltransferase